MFAEVTAARIRVPALHLGGWWDVFLRGQLRDWAVAGASTCAPQRLIMDATDHQWERWRADDERATDSRSAGPAFDDFLRRYLDPVAAFMDRELRQLDGARDEPVVRFHVAGAGWRDSPSWPPPGTQPLELWLADGPRAPVGPEGGALSRSPRSNRHTVRWTHDPGDLVPTLDRDVWWPLLGLPDERDVQVRSDVLTFTGAALDRHLDLVGPMRAALAVGASRGPYLVAAKLVDVSPDGRARRIGEGVRVLADPDRPPSVEIDLGHTAYRLATGHRVRLEIAGSSYPRYAPVLGSDDANELFLRTGAEHGSRLHLSVLN